MFYGHPFQKVSDAMAERRPGTTVLATAERPETNLDEMPEKRPGNEVNRFSFFVKRMMRTMTDLLVPRNIIFEHVRVLQYCYSNFLVRKRPIPLTRGELDELMWPLKATHQKHYWAKAVCDYETYCRCTYEAFNPSERDRAIHALIADHVLATHIVRRRPVPLDRSEELDAIRRDILNQEFPEYSCC